MEITIDVDEAEVLALRRGEVVPLSLRDKLGDAVHIKDVGWYQITEASYNNKPTTTHAFWWDGTVWRFGPDADAREAVLLDPEEPQRLYFEDER